MLGGNISQDTVSSIERESHDISDCKVNGREDQSGQNVQEGPSKTCGRQPLKKIEGIWSA